MSSDFYVYQWCHPKPEYAHMSDMEYAIMNQQKVKQARKFGKIRAKLVGQIVRHFPNMAFSRPRN